MNRIAHEVERIARETYPAEDIELVLLALSEMRQPNLAVEFAALRERVQLAILLLANGKANALLKQVDASQVDWRDTLVAADATRKVLKDQLVAGSFPPSGAA